MLWVPTTVGLYEIVQLLLFEVCAIKLHGLVPKSPVLSVEKVTVPLGADAPAPAVSVTVAVHVEA